MKTPRQKTIEILQPIMDRHAVTFDQITTGKRTHANAIACRNECMWELRNHGRSLHEIGRIFGRNHSTVYYGIGVHLSENNKCALYPRAAMYALKNYVRASL